MKKVTDRPDCATDAGPSCQRFSSFHDRCTIGYTKCYNSVEVSSEESR